MCTFSSKATELLIPKTFGPKAMQRFVDRESHVCVELTKESPSVGGHPLHRRQLRHCFLRNPFDKDIRKCLLTW